MSFLHFLDRLFPFLFHTRLTTRKESFCGQTSSEYLALALEYAKLADLPTLYEHQADRLAVLLEMAYHDDSFALLIHQIDTHLFELDDSHQKLAHQKDQVAIINEFILNDMDCSTTPSPSEGRPRLVNEQLARPTLVKFDSRDDLRAANFQSHKDRMNVLASLTFKTSRLGVLSSMVPLFLGSVVCVNYFSTIANSSVTTVPTQEVVEIPSDVTTAGKHSYVNKAPISKLDDNALFSKYKKWARTQAQSESLQLDAQAKQLHAEDENNHIEAIRWLQTSKRHLETAQIAAKHMSIIQSEIDQRNIVPNALSKTSFGQYGRNSNGKPGISILFNGCD
jgi:hypothetical protein